MKSFEVEILKEEEIQEKDAKGNILKDKEGKPIVKKNTTSIKVPIKPLKIEKGKGAGGEYYVPDNISTFDLKWLLSLFPEEELMSKLIRPKVKQFFSTITAEAAYDAGKRTEADVKAEAKEGKKIQVSPIQDEDKFIDSFSRMFKELSPRGESEAGLTRKQNELLAEIGQLDENEPGVELKVKALFAEIKRVRQSLAEKKTSGEGDSEPVVAAVAA